jgi:hypothetical protein
MEAILASPVLVALVTVGIGGGLGIVTQRLARTAQRETDTRTRVTQLEQRERLRDDYIHELRTHIAEEKGPPPPPWPEGLTR